MTKSINTFTNQGRQGDVYLRRIGKMPEGVVEVPRDEHGRVVLALGERTGHGHALRDSHVVGFKFATSEYDLNQGLNDFLLVGGSTATLAHEHASGAKAEHDPISPRQGEFDVLVPVEHTDEDEPRQIMD
jgi:hypothetical protein